MKSTDFLKEGLADDAHVAQTDHEVQLARKECYTAAENALALHKLLRNIESTTDLEGWVSAKITLANDYLNTVREHLEYQYMSQDDEFPLDDMGDDMEVITVGNDDDSNALHHDLEGDEDMFENTSGAIATSMGGGNGFVNGGPGMVARVKSKKTKK